MVKEKLTYLQKIAQKHIDPLIKEYEKTGEKTPVERLKGLFVISPIIVDCLNDLDKRLRKLEKGTEKE